MHRTGILLSLFFMIFTSSFAQDYTLSGKVRELGRTTGAPMTAVKIDVDSSSFIAFTDANGNYSISGIPSGVHNIRVSKPGFIGMFKKNYTLDGNKIFNVSLADTIQESPQGTQVLKLDEFRELPPFTTYKGLNRVGSTAYPSDNASTWNGITEGNLIPVLLLNATAYDSLQFKNAIGACNGDWTQSPTGSVEKEQKRALYLLSNDPQISYTKRGMRVTFNAGSTRSSIVEYESNSPYINKAETTLASNAVTTIQKEVQGRNWSKQDIRAPPLGRYSYMNGLSAGMTDLDHMINIVFYNHWAAIGRNEQNANILDMENTPAYGIPLTPSIKNPQNNATDLDVLVKFICDNEFGAEGYRWQVATDNTFNNKIIDAKALRIDTIMTLPENMTLYAKVMAESSEGNSGYSSTILFTTGDNVPTEIDDENINKTIRIYPNPVKSTLTIEFSQIERPEIHISIFNFNGQLLITKSYSGLTGQQTFKINTSSLEPGIFFLSITTILSGAVRQLETIKFLKDN